MFVCYRKTVVFALSLFTVLLAAVPFASAQQRLARLESKSLNILFIAGDKYYTLALTPKDPKAIRVEQKAPDVFAVENPSRLVIDLPQVIAEKDSRVFLEHKLFKTIRLGAHPNKTRIVLDIRDGRKLDYTVSANGRLNTYFVDLSFPEAENDKSVPAEEPKTVAQSPAEENKSLAVDVVDAVKQSEAPSVKATPKAMEPRSAEPAKKTTEPPREPAPTPVVPSHLVDSLKIPETLPSSPRKRVIDLLFSSQEEKKTLGLFGPDEIPAEVTNFRESQPVHFQGFPHVKIDAGTDRSMQLPLKEEKGTQSDAMDFGAVNALESAKSSANSLPKNDDQKAEEPIAPAQVAMYSEERAETADIAPTPLAKEIVRPAEVTGFTEPARRFNSAEENPAIDIGQIESQVEGSVESASSSESNSDLLAAEQIAKGELIDHKSPALISDLEKPVVSIQDRESMPKRLRRKLVLIKQDLRLVKAKIHLAAFQVWSRVQGMLSKTQEEETDSLDNQEEGTTGSGLEEAMRPADGQENRVLDEKSVEVMYVNDNNNSVLDLSPGSASSVVEESSSAANEKLEAENAAKVLPANNALARASMKDAVAAVDEFSSEQQKSSSSEPKINEQRVDEAAKPNDLSVTSSEAIAASSKEPANFGEGIVMNADGVITNTAAPLPADEEFEEAMAQVTAIDFNGPKGQALSSVVLKGAGLKDYTLLKSNAKHYMLTINHAEMAQESLLTPPQVPESTLGFISLIPKQEKNKVLVQIEVDDSVRLRSSLVDNKLWLKAVKK